MSEKEKTYGQLMVAHHSKQHEMEDSVVEYRRVMEKIVIDQINNAIERTLKTPAFDNHDFYVVLVFRNEVGGAIKPIAITRFSCPTPVYNQHVFKYWHKKEHLEFLWSIPDAPFYHDLIKNGQNYLDQETKNLARFCLLMESGELLKWVKKENGENKIDNVVIKIKKEIQ